VIIPVNQIIGIRDPHVWECPVKHDISTVQLLRKQDYVLVIHVRQDASVLGVCTKVLCGDQTHTASPGNRLQRRRTGLTTRIERHTCVSDVISVVYSGDPRIFDSQPFQFVAHRLVVGCIVTPSDVKAVLRASVAESGDIVIALGTIENVDISVRSHCRAIENSLVLPPVIRGSEHRVCIVTL